ncbi:MAG: hypothetical protein WCP95_09280 [Actinomycetes bacterium]
MAIIPPEVPPPIDAPGLGIIEAPAPGIIEAPGLGIIELSVRTLVISAVRLIGILRFGIGCCAAD